MIPLLEKLDQDIKQNKIQKDAAQKQAVIVLDKLITQLYPQNFFNRFLKSCLKTSTQGVYLWGGVGRGKTYLMDLFYECLALPSHQKKRLHFYRFMQEVHAGLSEYQGYKNPLKIIAKKWAKNLKVLCLDEFFVEDIADAMILGQLLVSLFEEGVVLVATSNRHPSELYINGLQREKFLPAIKLIEKHTDVISIDNDKEENIDYRLRVLEQAELYHYPLDQTAHQNLEKYFNDLAPHYQLTSEQLIIIERPIKTDRLASNIVWFDFDIICSSPRSQVDYIEIAKSFHTVLISNITIMDESAENTARRFIALVDEFYDRHVKLIVSAQTEIINLYQGKLLTFEFQRTISRLLEMQSQAYLSQPHLL